MRFLLNLEPPYLFIESMEKLVKQPKDVIIIFITKESKEEYEQRKKERREYYLKHKSEFQERYQFNRTKILERAKEKYKSMTPTQKYDSKEYNRKKSYLRAHGNLDGFVDQPFMSE
jgi:guanylate kinase